MWKRRQALADDDFWNLIAVLDGQTDDDATERLADALRGRGPKAARAFQERLAKALYDLAVLPDHHPARPALELLRSDGAAHLPPAEAS
jgi:hypothetical protein